MFTHSQVWMNEIRLLRRRIRALQTLIWKHLSLCPPPPPREGGGLFHVISVGHCSDVITSPNTPVRSWGCEMWRGLVAKKLQSSENTWHPRNLFRICEKSFHQSFLNHHDTDPGRRLARDQDLIFFIKISVNAEARILFFLSWKLFQTERPLVSLCSGGKKGTCVPPPPSLC